jgi:hypothetical protein
MPIAPAKANPFGDPWNESNFQRYWYEDSSMNSAWQQEANWVRNNVIDPTDLYTETRMVHDNADVAVYRRTPGATIVGDATCIDLSGSLCHHWHVRINPDFDPFGVTEKRHVTCHEFGHTVGLHHYGDAATDSCMKEPTSVQWSSHDRQHVNDYYRNNPNG